MTKKIAVLAGDGIGPEIMSATLDVVECLQREFGFEAELEHAAIGGAGYDQYGQPLPDETLAICQQADAILFGAIGGPQYEGLARELRPEKGLLKLRSALSLFSNLRPAILYPQLADASSLKAELVAGLDLMIVRELTSVVFILVNRGVSANSIMASARGSTRWSMRSMRSSALHARHSRLRSLRQSPPVFGG